MVVLGTLFINKRLFSHFVSKNTRVDSCFVSKKKKLKKLKKYIKASVQCGLSGKTKRKSI
jgi:hypothetical protein